jgi:DNA-binding transcriptional ArsR family regulator
VLVDAGLIIATRRKGWTYYRRDEAVITAVIQELTHL